MWPHEIELRCGTWKDEDYSKHAVRADMYELEGNEACMHTSENGISSSRSSDPALFGGAWTPWCPE